MVHVGKHSAWHPTVILAAYSAGCFDAEGSITLKAEGTSHRVRVVIVNTHPVVLEHIKPAFPGTSCMSLVPKQHAHRLQAYRLSCESNHAGAFLRPLLPYLQIKHERAVLALRLLQRTNLHQGQNPEAVKLVETIQLLNTLGKLLQLSTEENRV